ncbi:MAG TPA: radical SAM family heme chaperone HemW [Pyrinomonadaceae bacterium]|nr:radical SAM family heme chaperone HemW [Pyrinomonadaceae bacterium]
MVILNPAGIYIHIPFCRSRCSYCDFATGIYNVDAASRYVTAVARELDSYAEISALQIVDTIYFGGGTPSLLSSDQLQRLLDNVYLRFQVTEDVEVTLEMNPGTVTDENLTAFQRVGVNRASFGAQTFNDHELARLGRSHTAQQTRETFRQLRNAGFQNISLDLIAGLPGQTLDQWRRNIDEALSMRPEHLSFYLLEVHEGTPLANHIRTGIQPAPDEELSAEMYEVMLDQATVAGYTHYEISNLCLPGFESRHNTKYWTGAPYFGFGCSAHSYDGMAKRWSNERDVNAYVARVEANTSPITERRELNEEDRQSEAVFLGLRMMEGYNVGDYQDRFGVNLIELHRENLERFSEAGLLELNDDVLKLTRSGALLSNEVFAAFV